MSGPTHYAPALPWAARMDADDLEGFLADLSEAASGTDDTNTLAEVESVIASWREYADSGEPIPYVLDERAAVVVSVERPRGVLAPSADRLTRLLAPTQALREAPSEGPRLDPCTCPPHHKAACGHCIHDVCEDCDRCCGCDGDCNGAGEDSSENTQLAALAKRLREIHYEVDGSPHAEGSCVADGYDYPCPTLRAIEGGGS